MTAAPITSELATNRPTRLALAPAIGSASSVVLWHGDCEQVFPLLEVVDALISDPPYGGGLATDYAERFTTKAGKWWKNDDRATQKRHAPILGDDQPFDPSPLLAVKARAKVLWGANWYANRLPDSGAWWMWDKRNGRRDVTEADWPMGEGELAWTNIGKGVRIFRHTWFGLIRDSERGEHHHPTQKPVVLMQWCMEKAKVPVGATVLDPYMGSGTTGIAALRTGRNFIGIEKDAAHFKTAADRIRNELNQGVLL